MKKNQIKSKVNELYTENVYHFGLPSEYKAGMKNYNAGIVDFISMITDPSKIEYGTAESIHGGYSAWFKIGVQTFSLSPAETKGEAEWFVGCLKTAFKTLMQPEPFILKARACIKELKDVIEEYTNKNQLAILNLDKLMKTDRKKFVKEYKRLSGALNTDLPDELYAYIK